MDVAGWHLVGLDTTATYGQIRPGDAQYEWLAQDLAAHAAECTIVFFHHPRWGLGNTAGNPDMHPIWELLAAHDVEIALAGHEHNYQRWLPLNGAGQVDPGGVTQLVVGTGGHELEGFRTADARVASAVEDRDGALRVELTTSGADFQFMASDGSMLDSGSVPCTVPGAITLDRAESTTESWVAAELTNFTPGSEIAIRWEDGRVLRTARADSTGRARVSFHTPSAPYGSHVVTAEDAAGLRSTTRLSIIPRVKLTRETVPFGADLRVYLYGFAADQFVEVHVAHEDGTTSEVLGTVTTDSQGSASVRITLPTIWHPGASTVVARAVPNERLNASASIDVVPP